MSATGRFSIVLAVGIACLPGAARGQHAAPPRASAVSAGEPEPSTGVGPGRNRRVTRAVFHRERATSAAAAIPPATPELSMTAAMAGTVTPEPAGPLNGRLLDRDITAKFASLEQCRTDVARRKRVSPVLIAADTLKLRWTPAGKGQVAVMDVVGNTPVDAGALDCVPRDANLWLFAGPLGGDVRLNRGLVFRRLPPVASRP
jgi:hypothetical protein